MARQAALVQVNIRLEEEVLRTLEAAAFVDGVTVTELVRGEITRLAWTRADERPVKQALEARAAAQEGVR